MITVVVNFPLPDEMTLEQFKERMLETVPTYQAVPGLVRKNYLFDDDCRVGGGAYTFGTRKEAETCFSAEFVERVTNRFGAPVINYFDTPIVVDNEHGVVKS